MRYVLSAFTAGALLLTVTNLAPAQSYGSSYQRLPNTYVYPSTSYYAQPLIGGSFSYSTPSFGLGINIGPSYAPAYYPRPIYAPSFYPVPWYGHNHHHHHHHQHHNHHYRR